MHELALFAGAGGGILGGALLGWKCICAVELDEYAASVLLARQNDGCLAPFPIWDDIRTFDGRPWRGRVDVVSGGFPCTDISIAGRGAGIDGSESGLWREQARIIGEVRPIHVLVENSPALTFRGGLRVIGDLAAMGYDCRWGIISAADAIWLAGTPCIDHLRERIWIVGTRADAYGASGRSETRDAIGRAGATPSRFGSLKSRGLCGGEITENSDGERKLQPQGGEQTERGRIGDRGCENTNPACDPRGASPDNHRPRFEQQRCAEPSGSAHAAAQRNGWWSAEPDVDRMASGVPARVDRLRCIGMSQVPAVVRLAWETLTQ